MSDFGDFDADDAFDHEPADPEQVARRLHLLAAFLEHEAGVELPDWDHLQVMQQIAGLHTGDEIVNWLTSHAHNPEQLARDVHEFRRVNGNPELADWEHLNADEKAVAVALMSAIVTWLERQGAI